jgi:acyl carrier protein
MYETIKELLIDSFGVQATAVAPEATLKELDLDSLDLVEFSLVLQSELHIGVSDEELLTVPTFGELIGLLEARAPKAV